MGKPFIVAEVLMDADGKYYINAPQAEQGGTMGYGTQWLVDGDLHETCVLLESVLKYWHEDHVTMVKQKESAK